MALAEGKETWAMLRITQGRKNKMSAGGRGDGGLTGKLHGSIVGSLHSEGRGASEGTASKGLRPLDEV